MANSSKYFIISIVAFLLLSCGSNNCSNRHDEKLIIDINQELVPAREIIKTNIDSIEKFDLLNKTLAHQKAGGYAAIGKGEIWHLIDGAYMESILVKDSNLIYFEMHTVSCDWNNEFIVYQTHKDTSFLNQFSKTKIDTIQKNWYRIQAKSKNKNLP